MNKSYFIIFSIIAVSGLCILILFRQSSKPNEKNNGFSRIWYPKELMKDHSYECNEPIVSIHSGPANELLIRSEKPGSFYTSTGEGFKFKHHSLTLPEFYKNKFFVSLTNSIIHIMAYGAKELISYDMKGNKHQMIKVKKLFSPAIAIKENLYIIRSVDETGRNRKFLEVGNCERDCNQLMIDSLNDAGMVTDGQLFYDQTTGYIIYTYYFGNGFVCMDSNLKLVYRGRTIDTLTDWQAKVVRKPNSMTHLKPPKLINRNACVSNGLLYIESGLKADNETNELFDKNSVIDVYNIKDGRYEYSLHLPFYKNLRLLNFTTNNNYIIANYGQDIVSYRL